MILSHILFYCMISYYMTSNTTFAYYFHYGVSFPPKGRAAGARGAPDEAGGARGPSDDNTYIYIYIHISISLSLSLYIYIYI